MSIYSVQAGHLYQKQQQLKLAQQSEKYNNSIADYNLQKVIKYYTQAINSAENANDAKSLAEALSGFLSQYGQSIDDVKGINNPLLSDPTAAAKKKSRGNAQDKAVIKDLNEEFGVKGGKDKDWMALAKKDENVRILDKDGKDVTNERNGEKLNRGDILEVNSKKYGKVQVSVGGDGVINGSDDKVISMGGKSAAEGIFHGLNSINNMPANDYLQNIDGRISNSLFGTKFGANELDETLETKAENKNILNEDEIKNLLAAILNSALTSIEKKEQFQKFAA